MDGRSATYVPPAAGTGNEVASAVAYMHHIGECRLVSVGRLVSVVWLVAVACCYGQALMGGFDGGFVM